MISCLEVVAIKDFNRLNDVDAITTTQFFIRSFSHHRIHMDWIYSLALRMFIKYTANSPEHVVHRLTKVFSSMSCDEDELTISNPIKLRMSIIFPYRMLHSINDGIASDIDFRRVLCFQRQLLVA